MLHNIKAIALAIIIGAITALIVTTPAFAEPASVKAIRDAQYAREKQEKARDRAWFEAERLRRAYATCYYIDSFGTTQQIPCISEYEPVRLPPSLR